MKEESPIKKILKKTVIKEPEESSLNYQKLIHYPI